MPASALPQIPKKAESQPAEYPLWWRGRWAPYAALLLAAAAGDMLALRVTILPDGEVSFGLGAAVGGVLLMLALMLLRRDMGRGEMVFLGALSVSCGLALAVSGSMLCWLMVWLLPVFYLAMTRTTVVDCPYSVRYHHWWGYWFASQQVHKLSFLSRLLPWLISGLVGVVLFIFFLCIFASGNPVVELVWNHITDAWNRLVAFLRIDWDFGVHALLWLLGIVLFGVYTRRRQYAAPSAPPPAAPVASGRSILPQLPLMMLLGINLAFMIVNASDMAYLWFHRVPEGVSQTEYLHEGAASIIWASCIASLILIILFRAAGSARRGVVSRGLGYLLVVQTILLAGSVLLRLCYQIDDYGFTVRRIVAGEVMIFGVLGLVVLLGYMVSGRLLCWCARGGAAALVLLALMQINPPSSLAGDLNMHFWDRGAATAATPEAPARHWNFTPSDFYSHVPMEGNLTFALFVYDHCKDSFPMTERVQFKERMERVASRVEKHASTEGWLRWNWRVQRDIPAAERVLGRPIRACKVENTH